MILLFSSFKKKKRLTIVQQTQYASNKDFISQIKKGYNIFNKYYTKTNDSPLYAAALILNPIYNKEYIKKNWDPKQQRAILVKMQKLWEKYQEEDLITPLIITTSYDAAATTKSKALEKEPDIFD